MKVSECKKCIFCQRQTWSSSYKPAGYHKIGVTHAYHFCRVQKIRCMDVKNCWSFLSIGDYERIGDISRREAIESNILECAKKMYEIQEKLKPEDGNDEYLAMRAISNGTPIEIGDKFEDASCENCEHAYQGADPLKIIQDSGNVFCCSAGFKYGGASTVCSEWRRKEGGTNELN